MSAAQPGILAIFNDCRAGREDEFNAWFQGEHLQERLAVFSEELTDKLARLKQRRRSLSASRRR